jgi:hypothetical protein
MKMVATEKYNLKIFYGKSRERKEGRKRIPPLLG